MRTTMISLLVAAALSAPAVAGEAVEERVAESREAAKSLMQELKGALQGAMQSGGPVAAVEVCHDQAQALTRGVSQSQGLDVARTSHKLRNPANAPDAWEQEVLQDFLARRAAGEDPKRIERWAVVEEDGRQTFRYMKAIPTGEICLVCHGSNLAEPVAEKIEALYPRDRATGFERGDIRGAFTISQPM